MVAMVFIVGVSYQLRRVSGGLVLAKVKEILSKISNRVLVLQVYLCLSPWYPRDYPALLGHMIPIPRKPDSMSWGAERRGPASRFADPARKPCPQSSEIFPKCLQCNSFPTANCNIRMPGDSPGRGLITGTGKASSQASKPRA